MVKKVAMALFDNCSVVLELKNVPYKEKKRLKLAITENGGSISYVVNKQCTLIVTSSVSSLSSSRVRNVKKHQIPVVGVEYVSRCLEKGVLLPVEEYRLSPPPSTPPSLFTPRPASPSPSQSVLKVTSQPAAEQKSEVQSLTLNAVNQAERAKNPKRTGTYLGKFKVYTESDNDLPTYPTNFQVAKYSIFEKANSSTWSVLELQSSRGKGGQQQYRVVRYWREDHGAKSEAVQDKQVFFSVSEEAVKVYQTLRKELQVRGLTLRTTLPPEVPDLGSASLQQLLLEEKLSCSTLSQEVGVFVELLWAEALGCLDNVLKVPFTSLSLNDVSRAEGLLLQVQRRLRQGEGPDTEVVSLMEEVYTLLPHKTDLSRLPVHTKLISSQLDLCQLIRDVLNVSEVTLRSTAPSCLGKYRALRCSIERVPPGPEFLSVTELLQDRQVQILQVLKVSREVELQMFREGLGNIKPLLHSSSPSSFVGILSRGLLLPRVGVEHHGIERTDIGNLGGGIYFSDSMSTSLRYSKPSVTDGSRLLLVCDVALGRCTHLQKRDSSLTHAPEGYHSVHGVRCTPKTPSEFEDDEYVVYSPEQVRLQYVVQFRLEEDQLKDFQPTIDTSSTVLPLPVSPSDLVSCGEDEEGVGRCKNPLEEVTAGLLDSSGQPLPLQAVHVRAKLMDLLCQVIIFQTYTNQRTAPIEAKYVFPLDDSAAVCGFEAFINGKHVVGQVKEKQQARKEYKQAIERGHGAYLMDQDAPDVFTISVGNLPASATVLIKVTFVTELVVMEGLINFSLPGSVVPWQQSSALNQRTQVTLEKVCVTNLDSQGAFSLDMCIEMPNEIINLRCLTHKVKIKRTDCKAVVRTCPGETLGPDGFLLCFSLAQIHLPRMWVEKHPDKESQACMLVFYPDFEPSPSSMSDPSEVIILLDSSESMRGEALQNARRIALQLLNTLDHHSVRVNVISFGSDQQEAFLSAHPLVEALKPAKKFIMSSQPVGGSTELWRPLRSLSLLPPSQGVRNLLLLSDGHVQNQALTMQLVKEHCQHSRLFTCGLSPTANRHMLRALAQAGGGAYEFFDTKTKHTWIEKVACQVKRMVSPGCSSVSVKWQQFNPSASPPVQAPSQLHALFSDCHTLVYGFVQHCTQATLLGDLSGQDIETMVSTTELQKTRGTFLHKLTARAVIRDYEDGSLHTNEAEHEGKKAELKSFIIELSKEFSILSQFTSFVAIEERDSEQPDMGFTDVPKLISDEDVDFLPYLSWQRDEEEDLGSGMASMSDSIDSEPGRVFLKVYEEEEGGVEKENWSMHPEDPLGGSVFMHSEVLSHPYSCTQLMSVSLVTPSAASKQLDMLETLQSQRKRVRRALGRQEDGHRKVCADPAFDPVEPQRWKMGMPLSRKKSPPHLPHPSPCYSSPPPLPSVLHSQRKSLLVSDALPPQPQSLSAAVSDSLNPPSAPVSNERQAMSCTREAPPRPFSGISHTATFQRLQAGGDMPLSKPPEPYPVKVSMCKTSNVVDMYHGLPEDMEYGLVELDHCQQPPVLPASVPSSAFGFRGGWAGSQSSRPQGSLFEATASTSLISGLVPSGGLFGASSEGVVISGGGKWPLPPLNLAPSAMLHFGASTAGRPPQGSLFGSPSTSSMTTGLAAPGISFGSIEGAKAAPPPPPPVGSAPPMGFSFGATPTGGLLQGSGISLLPTAHGAHLTRPLVALHGSTRSSSEAAGPRESSLFGSPLGTQQLIRRPRQLLPLLQRIKPQPQKHLVVRKDLLKCEGDSERRGGFEFRKNILDVVKWPEIFALQHSEGFWECSGSLGSLLNVDVTYFANVFLKKKGISSLGVRAHADILRLVASLLVLQLMRVRRLEEGKLLLSLFRLDLDHAPQPRGERWEAVRRAVDWVCWADREYPCVCSRLEFGWDWESSTRQLLGIDAPHPHSPLILLGTTGGVRAK
ncbi:protein mono-ADP-ribosyltransferase PARP4 isoform X2 [Coregonus clupeaformis]|uniref:protein mono-ADP-ribosyltransferase PARP4 isoform X2 n=1 Tax=Coregonus clupeaformis TaxID=59861 RepID=UPI001E1C92DC|nr:protein mono-ADP-ribosyltransferase PARP4 isoform X2 [Coregonus clupeaformis]